MISKIIITGDCQRPIPGQVGNIEWLSLIVGAQIEAVTGIKPEVLNVGNELLCLNDWIKTLFDDDRDPYTFPSWHVKKCLSEKCCLAVGFEMPELAKAQFRKLMVPYIDIITYPVRFMDDLVLGFQINGLTDWQLKKNELIDIDFKVQARLIAAQLRRRPAIVIPENSALIVGQTAVDRSVIYNGRIWTLKDYEKPIDQAIKSHKKVYFKPHPHDTAKEANEGLLRALGAEITQVNVYEFLSNPNLAAVYGISSSVLEEARLFEKNAVYFGEKWHTRHIPIRTSAIFTLRFWSELLRSACEVKTFEKDIWCPDTRNRLRRSCLGWWGFDYVEKKGNE